MFCDDGELLLFNVDFKNPQNKQTKNSCTEAVYARHNTQMKCLC